MIVIINYEGDEENTNDPPVTTLEDPKKEDDEHIMYEMPLPQLELSLTQ